MTQLVGLSILVLLLGCVAPPVPSRPVPLPPVAGYAPAYPSLETLVPRECFTTATMFEEPGR